MRPHEIEIADNLIALANAALPHQPAIAGAFEVAKKLGGNEYNEILASDAVLSRAFVSIVDRLSDRGVPIDSLKTRDALAARCGGDTMHIIAIHNVLMPRLVGGVWKDQFDGKTIEEMKDKILELNLAGYPVWIVGQTEEDLRRAWELTAD